MFSSQNSQVSSDVNYIEDVFSTYLYTGNGSTQTITNGIDLAGKGGLTWIKNRGANANHTLYDTVRGVNKVLYSDLTSAQDTTTASLTAFNSNGFSVDATGGYVNSNTFPFVSWTFREQPKFFDVVTYTGTGVGGLTISHNLGSVPGCIILKAVSSSPSTGQNWLVYHRSEVNLGRLNSSDAFIYSGIDNITSTTFQPGGTGSGYNVSGVTYVAYLFAHDAGGFGLTGTDNVISCGSFTTDGTGAAGNITLGYESQLVMFKRSDGVGNWQIVDTMRGSSLTSYNYISPTVSNAESSSTSTQGIYPTATGFYVGNNFPGANQTYVYIAIRRGPMKVPTLGTSVFNAVVRTGTGSAASITGIGFPPDVIFNKTTVAAEDWNLFDKLRGRAKFLYPSYPTGESPLSSATQDLVSFDQNGFSVGDGAYSQINYSGRAGVDEIFRRAPGFLDVVCYTGTGSATTFNHNLAVIPELMIVKRRDSAEFWVVYDATSGAGFYLGLNYSDAKSPNTQMWNNTTPTSSVFSVNNSATNNSGSPFVAYLFATCLGVSKVGSYTGTGALQTVACGFTTGARFVMIKRTDSTGDWYVWDSVRGITSGNDPYVLMNAASAEVTSTNYVDTDTTGFKVTAAAPAGINASGGTYIFLAIA